MNHRSSDGPEAHDVGTLWTMRRNGLTARCALLNSPRGWELRVIVDGEIILTERCAASADAFQLAEHWKGRLAEQLWQQVVPGRGASPPESPRFV